MQEDTFYLIREKHFTRSVEVLTEWEKDTFTFELANAFKSVIHALMRTGQKVRMNHEKRPFDTCPCGFFVNDKQKENK